MLILFTTSVGDRNSVLHNASVVAHGYMSGGTAIDKFLRDNMDWMGKATNWAKFTATATLGVVHKGHVKQSMQLLEPYLPAAGGAPSASPYSEGGSLFALGLIHANTGAGGDGATIDYLQNALRSAGESESGADKPRPISHGACLGLGLSAMGSAQSGVYEDLKNTLYQDNAVAGEAASMSIGLLLLGQGSTTALSQTAISEMVAYAHETKHEKIIRGISLGLAMIMYGQESEADVLIEQLCRDKDPIIRYGAMYIIGLAFVGTGNNSAIRRLLHVAVSDVNDSVRRAAVTCLGFVLMRNKEKLPSLVALLAESFNPHVRYGACMAVGIGCAGTARADAIALLEPMVNDAVDYVRQGAMLAMALVMVQESDARTPKVKTFRDKLAELVADKHQTAMTKMGAILATGIMNAGGRNVTVSTQVLSAGIVTRNEKSHANQLFAGVSFLFSPLQARSVHRRSSV